jgi:hypothetical protein
MSIVEGWPLEGLLASVRRRRPEELLSGGTRTTLWWVTLLFFCVGDVVTTHVGLSMHGVVEAGPLVAPMVREYGLVAMVVLKAATVGLFYGVARAIPEPHAVGVPLGLAIVGVLVTAWNLVVICLGAL